MLSLHQNDLIASARAIIATSFWSGPVNALRVPKIETELVASMVHYCSVPLARAWGRILTGANYDLMLHAAFLHQRPYVRFPSPTTGHCGAGYCELADMLVVVEHDGDARRACLFQAKPVGVAVVGDQKDLYEKWEALRFASGPKHAKGRVYDIGPNADGGHYAIVNTKPSLGVEPWGVEHPRTAVTIDDMGRYLAMMLVANVDGTPGPGRAATVSGTDDWSVLISDLINGAKGSRYRLRHLWRDRVLRSDPQPISFIEGWFGDDDEGYIIATTEDAPPGEPPFERELPPGDDALPPINLLYLRTSPRAEGPRD